MIELNRENIEYLKRGLSLLKDFVIVNSGVELHISQFLLTAYNGDVETWVNEIISHLFMSTVVLLSNEHISNPTEIFAVLREYDEDAAHECYCEFLDSFNYGGYMSEEQFDDVVGTKEYNEDLEMYCESLHIKKLKLYSPLMVNSNHEYTSFLKFIPECIERPYKLYSHQLLKIDLEFDEKLGKNIIVMYIIYDRESTLSDVYCSEGEMLDSFEGVLTYYALNC